TGPVPGLAFRRDCLGGVVREPDDLPALVDGLDLRAARVAVVAEYAEQRVEVGRPGEQYAVGSVGHVVCAGEGGLATERAQALPGDDQLGPVICRQLRPHTVDRVEERAPRLLGLLLADQV